MSKLNWITPRGSIAQLDAGLPITLVVQAYDSLHLGYPISYSVIKGALPTGMSLDASGTISGTPVYAGVENTNIYRFTVRAMSTDMAVLDGDFSIAVTSSIITTMSWAANTVGDLGTVPQGEYYSLPLVAQATGNATITYSFVSGELPPGMQIIGSGLISGIPVITTPVAVDQSVTYRFTARATSSAGQIRDQAFSLTVTNVQAPVIQPTTEFLGDYFDGSYYQQQLTVQELNPGAAIKWQLVDGKLPSGITLSTHGL